MFDAGRSLAFALLRAACYAARFVAYLADRVAVAIDAAADAVEDSTFGR